MFKYTDQEILDSIDAGWYADNCSHIAIVSISDTECQCMDCLRIWKKEHDFKSDWLRYDRG